MKDCGGSCVIDECGVCCGKGIEKGFCACDKKVLDCSGTCGGTKIWTVCGLCIEPTEEHVHLKTTAEEHHFH